MTSRSILNIDTNSRTINPRSFSSVYVDLVSNQTIGGLKTFTSPLQTNSINAGNNSINTTGAVNCGYLNSLITTANEVNPYSGPYITSNGIWYLKVGVNVNLILDPNTVSGNRLTIFGISGGIKCLFYNISNTLGLFNSSTSQNIWSINDTGTISTTGSILTNTINPYSGNIIESSAIFYLKNGPNVNIFLDPNTVSGSRLTIYGVSNGTKCLFYNISNTLGLFNSITNQNIWSINDTGTLTCGNVNCGLINTGSNSISTTGALNATYINSSILTANDINPYSGPYINSTGIWYYKLGANVNLILNPNTVSGNRLTIYGISGGSKFLSYNTSDDLAVSTIWSINGTSGNINTIGSISGTTITGTTGILTNNINQISGASINTNAEWKFNSDVVLNNTGYAIYSDLNYAKTLTDSNTYRNSIKMNTLFTSTSIGTIELSSKYISFVNPYQTLSTLSKYFFINPISDGNVGFNINNVSGAFLQTTHATSLLFTNWDFATDNLMANTLTDSNSYRNTIKMNSLITSATKGTIEMRSEYISFVNPYHTISNLSQYFFIKTHTDGNVEFYINGFGAAFLETNHLTTYVVINWNLFVGGAATFTGGIGNQGLLTTSTLTVTDTNNSAAIYVPYGGIHLANNNYLYGRIRFGDGNFAYIAEYDTSDSDRLYLFGNLGIYCNTLPVVPSDIRLKENIEDFIIENPLEIIEKIRLVKYNRIDNPSKKRVLGYIAQEIIDIFPIAIEIDNVVVKKNDDTVLFQKNEDGTDTEEPVKEERLALNYHYMSMLNTEGIRELNNKVEKQQQLINTQALLIQNLITRLELLERRMID